MAKSKKELDKDLMFQKIMPALSDNPFSDLHGLAEAEAVPAAPAEGVGSLAAEHLPAAAAPSSVVSFAVPEAAPAPLPDAVPAVSAPIPESAPPAAVAEETELPPLDDGQEDDLTALRSRLFSHGGFVIAPESFCTVNVTEAAVRKNADAAMRRFNCCGCDRCRCDVITGALNLLPPHYVTGDLSMMEQYIAELPEKDIVAALVRAVLSVRAHPNH